MSTRDTSTGDTGAGRRWWRDWTGGGLQQQARDLLDIIGSRREGAILDVTMLGSTGTGKTTLLASMYERFGQVIGGTRLYVRPLDPRTTNRLQQYLIDLKASTAAIKVTTGLAGTGADEVREYMFGVGRPGGRPVFRLRFSDYSGLYLRPEADGTAGGPSLPQPIREKIQQTLLKADVILVAIDAPALMEAGGQYHDQVNLPLAVTDQIRWMLEQDTPRLLILAPIKCERYVSDEEGTKQLTERIAAAYAPLLSYIRSGDVRSRVACVLIPVQTIGSVVFNRIELDEDGQPRFRFSARLPARYAPVDTEQPLRLTLKFVLGKYRANERGMLARLMQELMGTDGELVAAMESFSSGPAGRTVVLQDHPYLHLGH